MRLPEAPPDHTQDLRELVRSNIQYITSPRLTLPDGRYLHWDELRHRQPPDALTLGQWWSALKHGRLNARSVVDAMSDLYDIDFHFVLLSEIQRALHEFDRKNVTRILASALDNEDAVTEYRVRQLVEEAISSSVIEGARPTTRELARQMVREGRKPETRDERMIHNNWRAMRRIVELRGENRPLQIADLLELHSILGEDALDVPNAAGVLRQPGQVVEVSDLEGNVWHTPPPAESVEERVTALLRFADGGEAADKTFIHPVIRAIIVHFWLGYEHPFRDGNGRLARALYYWCMLRHGYEMAEFLSISGPIDRSPKAYYLAFAHTETDGGDLTYFILNQLDAMRQALEELVQHLERRVQRTRELARLVAGFAELNHRQRALLQHAVRHPFQSYTIEGHAASHSVHYQTARSDLARLVERGYLVERRVGQGKHFRPSESLAQKISGSQTTWSK